MPASAIAAQLYTLRDFTRTPADIAATLRKVKQIGYDAVQVSGTGPIEPKELARMLKGEGLVCCATHRGFEQMRDQTEATIEEHKIIGCKYPAIGGMFGSWQRTAAGYAHFAREATIVARKLKAADMMWGYHNHSFELEKFGTKTGLDILAENSDPTCFTFEVDTYWIQHGGGDPAAWIRRFNGRIPLVHLKDMVYGVDKTAGVPQRYTGEPDADFQKRVNAAREPRPIMAEVGEGNLNWPAVLAACKEAGVVWYIVEQDVCQRDPFESLAISLRNLRAMGMH